MTLEEAIKHAEEVAKGSVKEYYRIANLEYHPNKKDAENSYTKCMECSKEHRQLAEWLRELKAYKESDWILCVSGCQKNMSGLAHGNSARQNQMKFM